MAALAPCWQAVWGVIFKICVIFGVRVERRKVDLKSKPAEKLKHADFILEYFEYFCQMSSKSILIILSYTVLKFARFFWDSVCYLSCWNVGTGEDKAKLLFNMYDLDNSGLLSKNEFKMMLRWNLALSVDQELIWYHLLILLLLFLL